MFRRPIMRRRGAPLLAAVAVGGVSYAAGRPTARRSAMESEQSERIEALEQQQAEAAMMLPAAPPPIPQVMPPAAPPVQQDRITQLKQLAELKERGVLTDSEFEVEKQRILRGGS